MTPSEVLDRMLEETEGWDDIPDPDVDTFVHRKKKTFAATLAVDAAGNQITGASAPNATVTSSPELEFGGIGQVTAPSVNGVPKEGEPEKSKPTKIWVACDWDDLKVMVVGRIENNVFAPVPWQPAVDGLPKEGGVSYEEFAPRQYKRAVKQLEKLCEVLESEGVMVVRPPLVTMQEAMGKPVGLTQVYAREAFSVFEDLVVVNQSRTPYRRKEARAAEALFAGHKNIVRLPPAPDDIADSLPDDPLPYLEGGDVYRLGKEALITMSGEATSPTGYRFTADALRNRLGVECWPGYIKCERYEHGDYVLMLVREGLCLACRSGFADGILPAPVTDWECVSVTEEEAEPGMAVNGIVLRENLLVVPDGNPRVVRALEKKGVDVIEIPFGGVSFFGGAIDCSTNEIWREPAAG